MLIDLTHVQYAKSFENADFKVQRKQMWLKMIEK